MPTLVQPRDPGGPEEPLQPDGWCSERITVDMANPGPLLLVTRHPLLRDRLLSWLALRPTGNFFQHLRPK